MMALSEEKLRKVVNMLSDPMQAHAAAHRLAEEAKERGVLVADLMAQALGRGPQASSSSKPPPPEPPRWRDAAMGQRVGRTTYGLQARVKHETDRAWLVEGPDLEDDDVWLPKSQCEYHGEDPDGRGIFIVPMWLARKKGFPI